MFGESPVNKETLRSYLTQHLKILYQELESELDMVDCAVHEGGIIQLEMLWQHFLKEDPPSKEIVLKSSSTPASKPN